MITLIIKKSKSKVIFHLNSIRINEIIQSRGTLCEEFLMSPLCHNSLDTKIHFTIINYQFNRIIRVP